MALTALITTPISMAYNTAGRQDLARQMFDFLSDLGDSEYRLARESLNNVRETSDQQVQLMQFGNAINHLESAAEIFEGNARRLGDEMLSSLMSASGKWRKTNLMRWDSIAYKVFKTYALITVIYAGLRQRELARKYMRKFYSAWIWFHSDFPFRTSTVEVATIRTGRGFISTIPVTCVNSRPMHSF